jgi:hypothetical protein
MRRANSHSLFALFDRNGPLDAVHLPGFTSSWHKRLARQHKSRVIFPRKISKGWFGQREGLSSAAVAPPPSHPGRAHSAHIFGYPAVPVRHAARLPVVGLENDRQVSARINGVA